MLFYLVIIINLLLDAIIDHAVNLGRRFRIKGTCVTHEIILIRLVLLRGHAIRLSGVLGEVVICGLLLTSLLRLTLVTDVVDQVSSRPRLAEHVNDNVTCGVGVVGIEEVRARLMIHLREDLSCTLDAHASLLLRSEDTEHLVSLGVPATCLFLVILTEQLDRAVSQRSCGQLMGV